MKVELQGFKAWLFVIFAVIGGFDILVIAPAVAVITFLARPFH